MRDRVALSITSFDRLHLGGYVPRLQTGGQLTTFHREQLGASIPSPALFRPLHERFVEAVRTSADQHRFFTIPASLEEAAMVDGCSQLGALLRVTLPLAAPGLAATSIFALIGSWHDLFFALSLPRANTQTLPVAAAGFVTEQGVSWGQIDAASVIMLAPIIVFTILMQKQLTRGLIAGGLKG